MQIVEPQITTYSSSDLTAPTVFAAVGTVQG